MKFREYIIESDYNEFLVAINKSIVLLESGKSLNEGILSDFSDKIKGSLEFIKQFAKIIGAELLDLLKIFKNKVLFSFFNKIGWSIKKLILIVKQGYNLWKELHKIIAKYISDTGVVKWTKDKLEALDKFLETHPMIKKVGALVVVGFLIYQWTKMVSFTGDIEFDFDQTVLFDAIKGNYSLADLFATDAGIQMLLFIATGVLTGLSFPWPGDTWVLFAISIIYTISKNKHPMIAKSIIKNIKKYKGIN